MSEWKISFKTDDVPQWGDIYDAFKKAKTDYVLGVFPLRNLILIEILTFYGRRIGEVAQLKKEDILPEQEFSTDLNYTVGGIRFPVEKSRDKYTPYSIKPLVLAVKQDILYYRNTLPNGAKLFNVSIRQMRNLIYNFFWKYLFNKSYKCKKCGIESHTKQCMYCGSSAKRLTRRPHVFRHSLVAFIRRSAGVEVAREWVDHINIMTTQAYGKYDIKDAYDKMKSINLFF